MAEKVSERLLWMKFDAKVAGSSNCEYVPPCVLEPIQSS